MACYCFVERFGKIVRCPEKTCDGSDFCKNHLILYNTKSQNVIVTDEVVKYVNPRNGHTIMDDTWFRRNEDTFTNYKSKLIPSSSSYTWIFVYHMVKRLEKKRLVTKIQRAWRRCISNPNYHMCRQRLMREAGELKY